jgi:uncharacterized protein
MNTQSKNLRILVVDILRGFALWGILTVNLPFFAYPITTVASGEWTSTFGDRIAHWTYQFSFEAKFYVLFSFLFGYSLSLQIAHADEAGTELEPRYTRRLVGLFFFGLIHAVFFFVGDILISYVLLGIVLWNIRGWQPARLVRFAVSMMVVAVVCRGVLALGADTDDSTLLSTMAQEATRNYLGGFGDAVRQRVHDLALFYLFTPLFNWPTAMAMFALGLAAGKVKWFDEPEQYKPIIQRFLPALFLLGVGGNALYASVPLTALSAPFAVGLMMLEAIAAPALTALYILVVLRLQKHLLWMAPAGKMSLSNYLGQGLIASFLFCGWGLGYFGQLSAATLLLLAPVLWGVQAIISTLYLKPFRYGFDARSFSYCFSG